MTDDQKAKAKAKVDGMVDDATEAPIHDDQRPMEAVILTALARVINGDIADLKYDLLTLDPSDFYFADHRAIFAAMKALSQDGDHVDPVTVGPLVGAEHPATVAAIFAGTMPDAGQVRAYRKRIVDRADVRELAAVGHAFQAAVASGNADDRADLVAKLRTAVFDYAATKRLIPDVRTEADVLDDFALDLADRPPGYSTGFRHLDDIITGLTPGLFVIAGPPSAGKTTFVKQLADQVAAAEDGPPVLFFTYEQSAFDIRIKTLARLSRCNNEDIKARKASRQVDAAIAQYKTFGHRLKIIEGTRQHTVGAIHLAAQQERQRAGKPPVIVIDYLQAMPTSDPALADRRSQMDVIVTDLRRIARDTDATIVAVSSMSRSEYNNAKMSAFKESGGIEYGADVAAVMTVEKEDEDKGQERTIGLVVLKNRHGRRGIVDLVYQMHIDTFTSTGNRFTKYTDAMEKTGKDGRS